MILFGRIQRYIFASCARSLVTVLAVMASAVLVIDTVEQLRTVGARVDLSLGGAIWMALLKLPMLLEQALPFGLLVATMVTFGQFSRRAELPVIRASGLSAWRFLLPPALLGLLLGIFATTLLSPFGAYAVALFEQERTERLDRQDQELSVFETGIWLRTGNERNQTVIHARSVDETGTLFEEVKLIEEERQLENGEVAPGFAFRRRIDAERARLADGFWQLENLVENVPGEPPRRLNRLALPTEISQSELIDRFAPPNAIGFWDLPGHIRSTEIAGLNAARYRVRWHTLMAAPALFVAMALIGTLASLRLARLGGMARLAAIGVAAALALFFVLRFAASLGAIGIVPPVVVAWAPSLFAIFACLSIVAFSEDG